MHAYIGWTDCEQVSGRIKLIVSNNVAVPINDWLQGISAT